MVSRLIKQFFMFMDTLGESPIEALRFVKDAILQHSIIDILITRSLLEVVKDSWKLYMVDLEAMKSIEIKEEVKKREPEAKQKDEAMKSQELSVLGASLGQLQISLTGADDSIKESNEQLKHLLTLKNCTKKEFQKT